jgi:hypothetical protein
MSVVPREARAIFVSGQSEKSGSTTISLAIARWLRDQGVHVAPLHLGAAGHWRAVPCPSAGWVSWPAALLSEACGVHPEPLFESGEAALAELKRRFDAVVVDGGTREGGLSVTRGGGRLRFSLEGDPVSLRELEDVPALSPEPEDLRALPDANTGAAPRCGIVSLPHLQHFADWAALRGAEWLTAPGIGAFDFLFLPMTSDRGFDREWLDQQGVSAWLRSQMKNGTRVLSVGWSWEDAGRIEPESVQSDRELSRLTRFRWPQRLPSDAEWEVLTNWIERGVGRERLLRLLP